MGNKKKDRGNQKDVTKYQMDLEMHDCCDDYLEKTKKDYSLTISQDATRMNKNNKCEIWSKYHCAYGLCV